MGIPGLNESVIHIVPQLPPQNSGVGDYATLVGRRMEELGDGVVCGYVAAGHEAVALPANGPQIANVTGRCNAKSLWQAADRLAAEERESKRAAGQQSCPIAVVLHYSGYGYERNGCPAWLVDALRNRPATIGRVVTFFHELYATGRPWQRAFWYSSRQQRIAGEIARFSDALLTNRAASARWLETRAMRPSGSIPSLPVPSNVGEPTEIIPWEERRPLAVLFGGRRFKESFLTGHGARPTSELCRQIGINTLVDIGERSRGNGVEFARNGIKLTHTGYLAADEVLRHFQSARVALIDYFPGFLAKSGVLAAVASHGIAPIIYRNMHDEADGVVSGRHYVEMSSLAYAKSDEARQQLPRIAQAVHSWYWQHSIADHARTILQSLDLDAIAESQTSARKTLRA
jgi:hypothetical protein